MDNDESIDIDESMDKDECVDKSESIDKDESMVGEALAIAAYNVERTGRYTYADYVAWDDDQRWELIDGEAYLMSAPIRIHQEIIGNLFSQLKNFLKGKHCKVYLSPFDVRLNADTEDNTVVQPDILVICDHAKLTREGSIGAPDMLIEVLSQSTSARDRKVKFDLYRKFGVREYWIVDPETKTTTAHVLKDGEYIIRAYSDKDSAPVYILEGCTVDFTEIYEE